MRTGGAEAPPVLACPAARGWAGAPACPVFRARKLQRRESAAYQDGGARCEAQDRLTLPPGRSGVTGTEGKTLDPNVPQPA